MRQKLLTLTATVSLALCLAAALMWTRSMVWGDLVVIPGRHQIAIRSDQGLISADISRADPEDPPEWRHDAWRHSSDWSPWSSDGPRWWNRIGFGHYVGGSRSGARIDKYVVPYYFLVAVTGLLPLAFLARRYASSKQFSLRELLAAMTVVAFFLILAALLR
jgi:hypothetical protein